MDATFHPTDLQILAATDKYNQLLFALDYLTDT